MKTTDDVADVAEPHISDRKGLADLYERSAPGAVRLAYLLTGDRAIAEDIAQDAFVRVAGKLVHLRRHEAFDAYLRRTVINLSRNHFRRRAIERAYLARLRVVDGSPSHDRDVVERQAMLAALQDLPHRQRSAIVLRFYEDLSEDAVADILRCRPATVRSLVFRGVQTLRSEMGRTTDA
jgi:RNA polymerase sigma-70 factor (sigma-E family)